MLTRTMITSIVLSPEITSSAPRRWRNSSRKYGSWEPCRRRPLRNTMRSVRLCRMCEQCAVRELLDCVGFARFVALRPRRASISRWQQQVVVVAVGIVFLCFFSCRRVFFFFLYSELRVKVYFFFDIGIQCHRYVKVACVPSLESWTQGGAGGGVLKVMCHPGYVSNFQKLSLERAVDDEVSACLSLF